MHRVFAHSELASVAKALLSTYPAARCFAFYADMGSGKTTLISQLCRQLGVTDTVSSPTFSIINEYALGERAERVYHMDWYRLKHTEDAIEAGVQDVLQQEDAWIFIEWPEIAEELLPETCVRIRLLMVDEETRQLDVL